MPSKKLPVVNDDRKKNEQNSVKKNPFTYGGSIVILVLIIVAFIWMPSSGKILGKKNPYIFGYYKGKAIELVIGNFLHQRFLAYNNYAQNQYQQGQSRVDPNNPYFLRQFWYQAYQDTVIRTALLDIAKTKKVAVSVSAVNEVIRERESEYMENGEFSPNLYQQTARTEQNSILKKHSENLVVEDTEETITSTARISDAEKKYLDTLAATEKQFSVIAFKLSEYPEEEVTKYAKENSSLFRKVSLSKITITSGESLAKDIYRQLAENNRLFEDLAKQYSTDMYKDNGGKMGWVYKYELDTISENDIDLLFNLGKEEISPIIENDYGFSIYRCDESARDTDLASSEDLEKVRYYLNYQASGLIEDYFVAKANELRISALEKGMAAAAREIGKSVIQTSFFPVTYGTDNLQSYMGNRILFKAPGVLGSAENVLISASTNQGFLEDLNAIKVNEISEPLISGQHVMIASLSAEHTLSSEEMGYSAPSKLFPLLAQQYYRSDFYSGIMESGYLEDNFQSVLNLLLNEENGL